MIFQMTYRSPRGDLLDLANNPDFIIRDLDGMTAADVELSIAAVGLTDGDVITNKRTVARQLTFELYILPGRNIEAVKRAILNAIKPKDAGVIYYDHAGRALSIDATVEKIALPRFEETSVMQITFYCAGAYWLDAGTNVQQIGLVSGLHHFPLAIDNSATPPTIVFGYYDELMTQSITNDGDAAVGMVIEIVNADPNGGVITNPKIERDDGAFFALDLTIEANKSVIISTTRGHKAVTYNGASVLSKVAQGSTWLQLEPGENTFTVTEDGGGNNMYCQFSFRRAYV